MQIYIYFALYETRQRISKVYLRHCVDLATLSDSLSFASTTKIIPWLYLGGKIGVTGGHASSRNQGLSQRQREAMEREPGNEACSNSNSELSFEHETWLYENEENWENIAATQQRLWLSKHVTSSRRAWENESAMSFVRSAVRDCSHSLCLEQVQLFAKIWLFLSLIGRVKFLIYGVRSTTVIFSSYGTC